MSLTSIVSKLFTLSSDTFSKWAELYSTALSANVSISRIFASTHHISHAYASIATGPRRDGIILVLDAIGEKNSGLIGKVVDGRIVTRQKIYLSLRVLALFIVA